ncbi:MAG TPA: translation initiation factor [Opitutaceae bacterium]
MEKKRIDTSGNANPLLSNPFDDIEFAGIKPLGAGDSMPGGSPQAAPSSRRKEPNRNRGRVDVVRQTAGRGGKTVTVLTGFKGIAARELDDLARTIRKASGVGGTVRSGSIEIQGDQREKAEEILRAAGFRPVRAGG